MTDLQILGLTEPFTYEDLRKAYRGKSKLFHPDKNPDNMNSHMAMIRLNRAYANLKGKLSEEPVRKGEMPTADFSYSIYRKGIGKFQGIHPSKWKSFSLDGLFDPSAIETHSETPSIIRSLIRELAEAYHCFSIIVSEYEYSPWYSDSKRKMKEIEKLTRRYMKIKESYEREGGGSSSPTT